MKKKSTSRLAPDDDTLHWICLRANFLLFIQKHFYLKTHPSPIGHGWNIINGNCRPIRNTKAPLPTEFESLKEMRTSEDDISSSSESEDFSSDDDTCSSEDDD